MTNKRKTRSKNNNYRDDMRFKWWVDNMLAPGLVTLEEMGAVFGRKMATGNIHPMTKQAIDVRVTSINKQLFGSN